jgi:molybdopterin synthase sulfur carrier subunit
VEGRAAAGAGGRVQVRVRLAGRLAAASARRSCPWTSRRGATVADALAALAERAPDARPALAASLPIVAGTHAARDDVLAHRQELALLLPVSGG